MSAGAVPTCECEDYHTGKPAWDAGLARYTNVSCTFVECPEGSSGAVDGTKGRDGDSGCVVAPGYKVSGWEVYSHALQSLPATLAT